MNKMFIGVSVLLLLGFMVIKYLPKTPEEVILYEALDNFTYVEEAKGEDVHLRYATYQNPFSGDCEDFAFTLQPFIGGVVWVVEGRPGSNSDHAVLLYNGIVYDNLYQQPIPKNEFPHAFITPLKFRGKVINN